MRPRTPSRALLPRARRRVPRRWRKNQPRFRPGTPRSAKPRRVPRGDCPIVGHTAARMETVVVLPGGSCGGRTAQPVPSLRAQPERRHPPVNGRLSPRNPAPEARRPIRCGPPLRPAPTPNQHRSPRFAPSGSRFSNGNAGNPFGVSSAPAHHGPAPPFRPDIGVFASRAAWRKMCWHHDCFPRFCGSRKPNSERYAVLS